MLVDIKRKVKKKVHNGILVMDNASAHTSKLTLFWFSKRFKVLWLHPQLPELNLIESIFEVMKKNIQDSKTQNLKELNLLLKKCWRTLSKDVIKKTIGHTRKDCSLILKYKGNINFK